MVKLYAGSSYRVTMKRMGRSEEDDGTKWYSLVGEMSALTLAAINYCRWRLHFRMWDFFGAGPCLADGGHRDIRVLTKTEMAKKPLGVSRTTKWLVDQHVDDLAMMSSKT